MLPGLEMLWRVQGHPCVTLYEDCLDLAWTYQDAVVITALPFNIPGTGRIYEFEFGKLGTEV